MEALFEKPSFLMLLLLVLLLFGAKRLPEVAQGVGRAARILKSETEQLSSSSVDPNVVPPSRHAPPA